MVQKIYRQIQWRPVKRSGKTIVVAQEKETRVHKDGKTEEKAVLSKEWKCSARGTSSFMRLRYFSANEIDKAIKNPEKRIILFGSCMVKFNKHLVLSSLWLQGYGGDYHRNIFRDIAITAQMSHLKNVLRLVGYSLELENPVMVYEYVEAMSLYELLFLEGNHDQNREFIRLRIANEIASVIVFLHSEFSTPIIYRNLSASNVIIYQNSGVAKITDFPLSISLPQGELEVAGAMCGHSGYLDPEYMQSGIASQKTDVYSFGVVLFQLLTGKKMSILDGKMIDFTKFPHVETNIEEGSVMDSRNQY
ncbi:PREDICTED: inactive serine/threonine-protein kinase At1g67470-like [Nicotiana attenuata]|uniref:inactive serine/threonine-protein kinase At1g67470-like n=1 Tax=Nicotiana attenuata TaxID=49451 RepID=UPI0009057BE0|nr:PREDICTED: inactive serine/threonine-protein kinase At1g67470-like [Nicotiana attenuata]